MNTASAEVRWALPQDYATIVRLVQVNHFSQLSESERARGFLSATFSVEQIDALARNLGIAVAVRGNQVIGFACASTYDFAEHPPVVLAMLEAFDRLEFRGQQLRNLDAFIYGPVCVAREHTGRWLLRAMADFLRSELGRRYAACVALVAHQNARSLDVHLRIGMQDVGQYHWNDKLFHVLVWDVRG